jgi:hypothetical protein
MRRFLLSMLSLVITGSTIVSASPTLEVTLAVVSLEHSSRVNIAEQPFRWFFGDEAHQSSAALLLIGQSQIPARQEYAPTLLTNEPGRPLYIFMGYTLLFGALIRLITSQTVRKYLADAYDPLNW